ncbi:MAG: hypothetical protein KatS3mg060_3328 [Dehalococcoidia bacterium]|nr:MAG: hypothetical protein KatS3mg060_3328 [Dehalococcoidia bacterium]
MTAPYDAMADWEVPLWNQQAGIWSGHVTTREIDGAVIDEHDVVTDVAIDLAGNRYAQRVVATRGAASEVRSFTAHWDGRDLVVQNARFAARARAVDGRVLLLTARSSDGRVETFETILLLSELTRARTIQHVEDGVLAAITIVSDERRIAPVPGIDFAGEPLPRLDPAP